MKFFGNLKSNIVAKKDDAVEAIGDWAVDHPVALTGICYVIGLAVAMPLCVWSYKYLGKRIGRETAKELAAAGVRLSYNHD